jgi:hypothetical protein
MNWTLNKGDRIRLKVRTIGGFKGYATVLNESPVTGPNDTVEFCPEGCDDTYYLGVACRHEVAKCRNQGGHR